jgi:hypothetical protein
MAPVRGPSRGRNARLPTRREQGPRPTGGDEDDAGRPSGRPVAAGPRSSAFTNHLRPVRVLRGALPAPPLGHVQLRQLHADQLAVLYRRLAVDGGRAGSPLAAKTILNLHQLVRAALETAVTRELIVRNPAVDVQAPDPRKRPSQRRRAASWTAGELATFLEAVESDRHWMSFRLAAATGMRRGELLGPRLGCHPACCATLPGSSRRVSPRPTGCVETRGRHAEPSSLSPSRACGCCRRSISSRSSCR